MNLNVNQPQTTPQNLTLFHHTVTGCYYALFADSFKTLILKPRRTWRRSKISLNTSEFRGAITDARELSIEERTEVLAAFPLPAFGGQ